MMTHQDLFQMAKVLIIWSTSARVTIPRQRLTSSVEADPIDTFPASSANVYSAYRRGFRSLAIRIVLGGIYLTVYWVVDIEDEEQSYGAKKHGPLGNKVELFELNVQRGGATR
jgi:hypothetical protein